MSSHEMLVSMHSYGECITRHLARHVAMPAVTRRCLNDSVLRHLDSRMLIEDPLTPLLPLQEATPFPLPAIASLPVLDEHVDAVGREGFGRHFLNIIGLFGHIMLTLAGSEQQNERVRQWVAEGKRGAFLMTDAGGPSLHQWRSQIIGDVAQGSRITLDKEWGIGALECEFAIVVLARPGQMIPQAYLLPPDACAQLNRQSIGAAYLDGHVQLGNCQGDMASDPDWAMRRGGLMAVKQFLTFVRPRFVRALMQHLHWLEAQGRLSLDEQQNEMRAYLEDVARQLSEQQSFTRYSEDDVMALKFSSNALLFDLVEKQRVPQLMDQRDLLGFTKMEGSSYRCLLEIWQRNRGKKHA